MKLRKGMKLIFKDRTETIEKASNNHLTGMIKTDRETYSTDLIQRWLHYGFIKAEKK
jgi:hypothetical protein